MKKLLIGTAVLCAAATQAAVVSDCREANFDISTIIAKSEKTYANGSIVAYEVDRIEPAAAPSGIAINLFVEESEGPAYIKCQAISGLSSVNWAAKQSSYDEDRGLLLTVPAHESRDGGNTFESVTLKIRINQERATVVLE